MTILQIFLTLLIEKNNLIFKKRAFQITKKSVKNIKSFVYRGKSFQFDFNIFKENSIYMYENRLTFNDSETINLLSKNDEETIDLSDQAIKSFINCCEGNVCQIDSSNVISLQFLSYVYDVPQLKEETTNFISEDFNKLAIDLIIFKSKINNDENQKWIDDFVDCSKEESILVAHLTEYLKNDDLLVLPICMI